MDFYRVLGLGFGALGFTVEGICSPYTLNHGPITKSDLNPEVAFYLIHASWSFLRVSVLFGGSRSNQPYCHSPAALWFQVCGFPIIKERFCGCPYERDWSILGSRLAPPPPCTERARQGYRAKGSRSRIFCVAVEELRLSYYMGTASIKEV